MAVVGYVSLLEVLRSKVNIRRWLWAENKRAQPYTPSLRVISGLPATADQELGPWADHGDSAAKLGEFFSKSLIFSLSFFLLDFLS